MSHKVHPKLYRIRGIDDWDTKGYYRNPAKPLEEDFRIREFLKKKIGKFGVEKVEIERFPGRLNIIIFSARPGLIIGRGGEDIEKLKKELEKKVLKRTGTANKKDEKSGQEKKPLLNKDTTEDMKIEIREIKNPWESASLAAQWVAQQLEKRVAFRRVLKQSLSKILESKKIEGARVEVAGRLNGAEMSRREWVAEGKLPRQTIRADIDYAKAEAYCSYGVIGVKVWMYKGERFD